ncbi:hypothetical protein ACFU98_04900 [Streptomyces sp. NPDC057575]|uniref:hypothetical protein n=1 Tax=unclassified Streptomyces TaxID=2593676 RepID=UPI0036AFE871
MVPSPLGAFFGRTFRGDWAGSVKAAAWPTGLILALAVALAIPSYGQGDDVVVGWGDRLRIALAMLLQAFGGGFELRPTGPVGGENSGGFGDSGFGDSGYGDGGYDFGGGMSQGGASLSVVPLTVTVLWVGALILGARRARAQGGGLEAAVRIGLVASAAVLVLGLFAQPDVQGVSVSSAPLLATLGALVISLLVTGGVLQREAAAQWLAARPVALTTVRAVGTAVRALGAVLLLCGLIGYIAYANADDVDGTAMLLALPLLPNIGLAVLGLSWGAPVEYDVRGQVSFFDSGTEHGSVGLSELGEAVNGWAVTGALATGVVCALTVGIWAARRSADRREQATAGALFLAMFLVLTGVGGVSVKLTGGGFGDMGGQGTGELATSVPDALLFGLLWVGGAVLVAPHLLRLTGRVTPVAPQAPMPMPGATPVSMPAPPLPGVAPDNPTTVVPAMPTPTPTPAPTPTPTPTPNPAPYDPSAPADAIAAETPAPTAYDPQTVGLSAASAVPAVPDPYDPQTVALSSAPAAPTAPTTPTPVVSPASPPDSRKRAALIWTGTLVAALLVGGGATAGVLALTDRGDGAGTVEDGRPTARARSSQSPSAEPSQQQTPSAGPTPSASASAVSATPDATPSAPTVPEGFRLVSDTAGFSFAVPTVWDRRSEKNNQITYAGSTGRAELKVGVIHNAPYSSYDNFTTLERTADANQKNYRRIGLTANTFQGRPGAIWEYTYEDRESGETIHAIDQSYIADDGTEYAIYTTERDTEWPGARRIFDTALSTWMLNDID